MGKVLVIRYGGVGDIITTFPVLKSLKENGYSVTLASNLYYRHFCLKYGYIDNFIPADTSFFLPVFSGDVNNPIITFLNQFDIILSYTEEDETISATIKKYFRGKIIFHSVKPVNIKEHIVKYLLRPVYQITDRIYQSAEIDAGNKKKEFFVIHPGSGSPYKNWAKERFLEVYKILSSELKGIILIGYAEKGQKNFWYKNIPSYDIIELEDIEQAVYYAARSYFYIGNDSGISHFFAATQTPSIVIFGPTSPYIWSPVSKNVKILYKNIPCSPCDVESRRICRKRLCLNSITVNDVIDTVGEIWKKQ